MIISREKQLLGALVGAMLLANVAILSGNIPAATAQTADVTIRTSADDHGMKFFGEGVLQVVITDEDTDDDSDDTIIVRINADGDNSDSDSFEIPNTNEGSQKFEFFLVNAASQYADGTADDGTELDPINNEGFDDPTDGYDGISSPIIRFGEDSGTGIELDTGEGLFEAVQLEIQYSNTRVAIDYEETGSVFALDRETYGTESMVYIFVQDQDANLNPTERESFTVFDADLDTLFEMSGASFVDDVTFEETGQNTAIFEAKLQLVQSDTATDNPAEIESESRSVSITLNDMVDYIDISSAENDDSNDSSQISFTIEDRDGELDQIGPVTFGSELTLILRDNDQNRDSDDDETLQDVITVQVGNAGGDVENLDMEETEDNSGVFVIDASNNELKITFLADGENPTAQNGILELRKSDIDKDITISYDDELDEDSTTSITSRFTTRIQTTAGKAEIPERADLNDDVMLTIRDQDLNDNPRSKDSYVFTLTGDDGLFALNKGGDPIGALATIEIEIAGNAPDFDTDISYALLETEVDSGVFTTVLKLRNILASADSDVNDGDRFRVTYNDLMERSSRESTATLVISRPSTALDFSRSLLPIPPENEDADPAPESSVGGLVGSRVVTTLIVTDVRENIQPNTQNTIGFDFRNDPGNPRPSFTIRVEGDRIDETIDTTAKYEGTDAAGELGNTGLFLIDILPDLPALKETGRSTGIFEEELVFVNDGSLDTDDWHNLKLTVTYTNDLGDSQRSGITFRGNHGIVSVDHGSAMSGDTIAITVQDEDLNLNDGEIEEFRSSLDTDGIFILAIEPEDDEIESKAVSAKTFRETGEDTGIFTATFSVGGDIPVSENIDDEINQATSILVTYNDEVDSTGRSGDEMEISIPVVTSTGSIQITPELIGPGTKLTVLIADSDLNFNPRGTDKIEGDNDGDGFVVFRTDRKDAGKATPDIDETASSSGVFQFEIQLVPIEGGEDGEPIEVQGGSEPRIGVLPGDLLAVRYEDENDSTGRSVIISEVIEVQSWDPEFVAEKESYEENDRVTIMIADPDANQDPDIADSITDIRVSSERDRVGRTFSALETGKDSGVFRLSFTLSTGTQQSSITARNGDEVTIQYEDEFPASYKDRARDNNPEEKFFYTLIVGASKSGTGSTTPSVPQLKDITGSEVSSVTNRQQVVLSTTIKNNNAIEQPFAAIIEVRNGEGVTDSLQWQTGTLGPDNAIQVGVSWMPENAGNYQVRVFIVTGLEKPQVLSPIVSSGVVVG